MNPGDLVMFKEGSKGFALWGNHVYIYLETHPEHTHYCQVLQDTGKTFYFQIELLEAVQ